MRLWGLLLCLATAPRGVLSEEELKQWGSQQLKPSQTLSLTCADSRVSLTNSGYCWDWMRQPPGKGLEWMGRICYNGNTDYSPSLRSRTSISRDTSKSQVFLKLISVSTDDSAVYFCAAAGYVYWGQGTLVTVSSANPTSPSLFPLSLRSVDDARNVVIGCLVKGFFPSQPLSVTWSQSGQDASVRNFPPVLNPSGDSLYTMISQLTLPASQCQAGTTKTCQVQHLSSPSKSVAVPCTVPTGCPSPPTVCCQPKLSLRRPAIEDLLLGSSANLTCTLSGLEKGQEATFTWKFSGRKNAIQGAPQPDASGCYRVSSVLPDSAEAWNSGDTFSCTATYSGATNGPLTVTITKPRGNSFRPQVHLLPPPSEELALNELVTLTCLVRGFSPEDLLLRWLHGNQELAQEKYLLWAPVREAGQGAATFAVTSVLRVEAEKWKSGDNFSCMVGHEALPMAFTQKTIDRLAGKPTNVNVSVVLSEVDGTCY